MLDWQRVEANLAAYFTLCAKGQASGARTEGEEHAAIYCGYNDAVFNAGFVRLPVFRQIFDSKERIASCDAFFAERQAEYTLWLTPERIGMAAWRMRAGWYAALGLREEDCIPGMECERLTGEPEAAVAVRCAEVASEAEMLEFCGVLSSSFALPFPRTLQIYGAPHWAELGIRMYAAVGGEIVACGIGVPDGRTGGIYCLATLPQWRGKGVGSTLIKEIAKELEYRFHCNRLVLQSTTAGLRMYKRLGFAEVTQFSLVFRAPQANSKEKIIFGG